MIPLVGVQPDLQFWYSYFNVWWQFTHSGSIRDFLQGNAKDKRNDPSFRLREKPLRQYRHWLRMALQSFADAPPISDT